MIKVNIRQREPRYTLILLVLFLLIIPAFGFAGAEKAAADGSFIQPMLCGFWTDAEWQKEFTAMKDAGMHYIIIGTAAECAPGKAARVIYPTNLPNTERAAMGNGVAFPDVIENCLRNAEVSGMKVFVGIGNNESWWKNKIDSTWLYKQMDFDNKVCDELWQLYKKKYPNAFYGWYWTYEIANFDYTNAEIDEIATAMNMQLDHLIAANEKIPFMWCPYMNAKIGTPEAYQKMWENIFAKLHTAGGDIFAPQDCVGAGGLTLGEVVSWFSALRKAVDTKPGLKFWSDIETFDHHDWSSASIDRIVTQLKLEQPYVDNYITFAYSHYQSPNVTDSGFQTTYLDYLKTGTVETTPPAIPQNLTAALQTDGRVLLKWNASTDNIGVCGYYIYRNGAKIHNEHVPIIYGEKGKITLATSYTDKALTPDTNYTYQVQAYDFASNVSSLTVPITVTTSTVQKK
jgi:hypothetical protein